MLVLSRKVGERIWIGDAVAITIVKIAGGVVRIGVDAPEHLPVLRDELKQNTKSVVGAPPVGANPAAE